MVKQFKIGWKTMILIIFSSYHVHFLRFFFEHLKSYKIRRGENFKNWVCSFCPIWRRTYILKNKDDWPTWGNVMSDLKWNASTKLTYFIAASNTNWNWISFSGLFVEDTEVVGWETHNLVDLVPSINHPPRLNSYFVTQMKVVGLRSDIVKAISIRHGRNRFQWIGFWTFIFVICLDVARMFRFFNLVKQILP
jgi:hypothetical protein